MAETLREYLAELAAEGITDARRYDRIRKFLAMKARTKRIPISGTFELTPLCNLDCKMCYVHLNEEQLNGTSLLPLETWIRIAQQAIDAGMLYAQVTGGECLTYPHFKEFYLFLRSRGIEISLRTNGILLKNEMLDFILQNPPAVVSISIYGASEDGYETVTGHRVLHQILQNIEALQKADIPLTISVTPSDYMKDGEAILELLRSKNLHWDISPALIHPNEETGRTLADASLPTYLGILKKSRQLLGLPLYRTYTDEELPPFGNSQKSAGPIGCAAGKGSFAVSWRGELTPCISFPGIRCDLIHQEFQAAWNQIGRQIEAYPAPAECNGCAYSKVCPICVVPHTTNTPAGHVNRSICEWNKEMIKAGLLAFK